MQSRNLYTGIISHFCDDCNRKIQNKEKGRKKDMAKQLEMTLEDAIELLRAEYEKAQRTKYVINPLAWALYHTWEKVHKAK